MADTTTAIDIEYSNLQTISSSSSITKYENCTFKKSVYINYNSTAPLPDIKFINCKFEGDANTKAFIYTGEISGSFKNGSIGFENCVFDKAQKVLDFKFNCKHQGNPLVTIPLYFTYCVFKNITPTETSKCTTYDSYSSLADSNELDQYTPKAAFDISVSDNGINPDERYFDNSKSAAQSAWSICDIVFTSCAFDSIKADCLFWLHTPINVGNFVLNDIYNSNRGSSICLMYNSIINSKFSKSIFYVGFRGIPPTNMPNRNSTYYHIGGNGNFIDNESDNSTVCPIYRVGAYSYLRTDVDGNYFYGYSYDKEDSYPRQLISSSEYEDIYGVRKTIPVNLRNADISEIYYTDNYNSPHSKLYVTTPEFKFNEKESLSRLRVYSTNRIDNFKAVITKLDGDNTIITNATRTTPPWTIVENTCYTYSAYSGEYSWNKPNTNYNRNKITGSILAGSIFGVDNGEIKCEINVLPSTITSKDKLLTIKYKLSNSAKIQFGSSNPCMTAQIKVGDETYSQHVYYNTLYTKTVSINPSKLNNSFKVQIVVPGVGTFPPVNITNKKDISFSDEYIGEFKNRTLSTPQKGIGPFNISSSGWSSDDTISLTGISGNFTAYYNNGNPYLYKQANPETYYIKDGNDYTLGCPKFDPISGVTPLIRLVSSDNTVILNYSDNTLKFRASSDLHKKLFTIQYTNTNDLNNWKTISGLSFYIYVVPEVVCETYRLTTLYDKNGRNVINHSINSKTFTYIDNTEFLTGSRFVYNILNYDIPINNGNSDVYVRLSNTLPQVYAGETEHSIRTPILAQMDGGYMATFSVAGENYNTNNANEFFYFGSNTQLTTYPKLSFTETNRFFPQTIYAGEIIEFRKSTESNLIIVSTTGENTTLAPNQAYNLTAEATTIIYVDNSDVITYTWQEYIDNAWKDIYETSVNANANYENYNSDKAVSGSLYTIKAIDILNSGNASKKYRCKISLTNSTNVLETAPVEIKVAEPWELKNITAYSGENLWTYNSEKLIIDFAAPKEPISSDATLELYYMQNNSKFVIDAIPVSKESKSQIIVIPPNTITSTELVKFTAKLYNEYFEVQKDINLMFMQTSQILKDSWSYRVISSNTTIASKLTNTYFVAENFKFKFSTPKISVYNAPRFKLTVSNTVGDTVVNKEYTDFTIYENSYGYIEIPAEVFSTEGSNLTLKYSGGELEEFKSANILLTVYKIPEVKLEDISAEISVNGPNPVGEYSFKFSPTGAYSAYAGYVEYATSTSNIIQNTPIKYDNAYFIQQGANFSLGSSYEFIIKNYFTVSDYSDIYNGETVYYIEQTSIPTNISKHFKLMKNVLGEPFNNGKYIDTGLVPNVMQINKTDLLVSFNLENKKFSDFSNTGDNIHKPIYFKGFIDLIGVRSIAYRGFTNEYISIEQTDNLYICKQPSSYIEVFESTTLSLNCSAQIYTELSEEMVKIYQWQQSLDNGNTWRSIGTSQSHSANIEYYSNDDEIVPATLEINNISLLQSNTRYRCKVSLIQNSENNNEAVSEETEDGIPLVDNPDGIVTETIAGSVLYSNEVLVIVKPVEFKGEDFSELKNKQIKAYDISSFNFRFKLPESPDPESFDVKYRLTMNNLGNTYVIGYTGEPNDRHDRYSEYVNYDFRLYNGYYEFAGNDDNGSTLSTPTENRNITKFELYTSLMSKDNKNVGSITKYWEYEVLHPNIIVYTGESLTAILSNSRFDPELKYGIKILDSNNSNITINPGTDDDFIYDKTEGGSTYSYTITPKNADTLEAEIKNNNGKLTKFIKPTATYQIYNTEFKPDGTVKGFISQGFELSQITVQLFSSTSAILNLLDINELQKAGATININVYTGDIDLIIPDGNEFSFSADFLPNVNTLSTQPTIKWHVNNSEYTVNQNETHIHNIPLGNYFWSTGSATIDDKLFKYLKGAWALADAEKHDGNIITVEYNKNPSK